MSFQDSKNSVIFLATFFEAGSLNHWALLTAPTVKFEGKKGLRYHVMKDYKGNQGQWIPQFGKACYEATPTTIAIFAIGRIKPGQVDAVHTLLQNTPIDQHTANWNCISWAKAAFEAVRTTNKATKRPASDEGDLGWFTTMAWDVIQQKMQHFIDDKAQQNKLGQLWDIMTGTEVEIPRAPDN